MDQGRISHERASTTCDPVIAACEWRTAKGRELMDRHLKATDAKQRRVDGRPYLCWLIPPQGSKPSQVFQCSSVGSLCSHMVALVEMAKGYRTMRGGMVGVWITFKLHCLPDAVRDEVNEALAYLDAVTLAGLETAGVA